MKRSELAAVQTQLKKYGSSRTSKTHYTRNKKDLHRERAREVMTHVRSFPAFRSTPLRFDLVFEQVKLFRKHILTTSTHAAHVTIVACYSTCFRYDSAVIWYQDVIDGWETILLRSTCMYSVAGLPSQIWRVTPSCNLWLNGFVIHRR